MRFQPQEHSVSSLSGVFDLPHGGRSPTVVIQASIAYTFGMRTLSEIEAVVDALSTAEKQELLLFLAARLRAQAGRLPAPRKFSPAQLNAWIAADEAEMQRLRDGK